jgi:dihydrofolate reductase
MEGGATGIDDDFAAAGQAGIGATIMGRNMFGPIRGPWGAAEWKGWWGDTPPYHHPVFVLTHHPRPPLEMEGGTTFHFVTGGIQDALDQARAAAADRDVLIGGGATTVQQYLRAGLVDEMHLAIVPVVLGGGARLFEDIAGLPGYECVQTASTPAALHIRLVRTPREQPVTSG